MSQCVFRNSPTDSTMLLWSWSLPSAARLIRVTIIACSLRLREPVRSAVYMLRIDTHAQTSHVRLMKTRSHAIAKMTSRCAQYMSALKTVCKRKSSQRLRKNLHITILSLFGGEIIFEVFQPMWKSYLNNVTDSQTDRRTDRRLTVA